MEEKKKPEKLSWDSMEELFATSVIRQAKARVRIWRTAFFITLVALIADLLLR